MARLMKDPRGVLLARLRVWAAFALVLIPLVAFCETVCAAPASQARETLEAEDAAGPTLLVRNKSHRDLVAIRVNDGTTTSFARLDLGPGGENELENPGGVVELRLDLGLQLTTWKDVDLLDVVSLTLCSDHENCLVVVTKDGSSTHLKGEASSLLPDKSAQPVCSLEGFRAGMTMRDACGLMQNFYTMEEDVYLATLGFANIAWAARLYANTEQGETLETAVLENVELRQKLSVPNLQAVMNALKRLGYVPWQAAYPGIELTLTDMGSYSEKARAEVLDTCTDIFLRQGRGIASILYAPKDLIDKLASEEMQSVKTQLYTISMHRDSDTLILDMSAYNVDDVQEDPS